MKTIFITGTDTGIGKTYITVKLIKCLNLKGYKTFGMKPIASGCKISNDGTFKNSDAISIQRTSSIYQPYRAVNPIALEEPIAPNIAANNAGLKLSASYTAQKILSSIQQDADINLIEGIGGWAIPLNNYELFAEVICELRFPIILVVGIKLGCLNHAILTSNSITQMKAPFIGWIANCLDPDTLAAQENIQTLKKWIPAPCLSTIPYSVDNTYNDELAISKIIKYLFN